MFGIRSRSIPALRDKLHAVAPLGINSSDGVEIPSTRLQTIDRALDAIAAEGTTLGGEAVAGYLATIGAIATRLRDLKEPHLRTVRNEASWRWADKREVRVAEALALLEAQEAAAAK